MKRVLVIAFSDLGRDMRVRRELLALKDRYEVVALGDADPGIEGVAYIPSGAHPKTLLERLVMYTNQLLGRFAKAYWYPKWLRELKELMAGERFDAIIANDTEAMPLAMEIKSGGVLFDSHEYAPKEFENSFLWRLLFRKYRIWLCQEYIPRADACITVAPGIAAEFQKEFGRPFEVVTNASPYRRQAVKPTGKERIDLVHHGLALPSRRLESMIEVMKRTDARYHLHFYLMKDEGYIAKLKKLAEGMGNITFHPPVAAPEIPDMLAGYDMGLYLIEGANFNEEHSLPNKFFEFIQARLAIAIGPSVEMKGYVEQYGCGVVTSSFDPAEMAGRLNALTAEDIDGFKQGTAELARVACAEHNAEILQRLVGEITGE